MSFDQRQPKPRWNRRGTKFIASGSVVRPGGPLSGARICRSLGHFTGGAEGFSRASRRAVRFRPPRSSNNAGSRWAYRGRPAHPYAQSARDTPRQHSLGSRDRCPVCAPGAAYAPDLLIFVLLAPRKDGAAAGGIPLPRRLLADTWRLKKIRCPSACNKAWRT